MYEPVAVDCKGGERGEEEKSKKKEEEEYLAGKEGGK